jgi:hypothetical protein
MYLIQQPVPGTSPVLLRTLTSQSGTIAEHIASTLRQKRTSA